VNFWINVVFYQATWLAAIAGAARGWWWAGPAMFAAFAAWQLAVSRLRVADLELMLCAAVVGFFVDSFCIRGGLFVYAAPVPSPDYAPIWIVALWMSFALTLNHSLAWLKSHLPLASVLGAVGAPLAYLAAARGWHALAIAADPTLAFGALALAWAILTPTLFWLAGRLSPPMSATSSLREAWR
jgi:hypothetical protein